MPIDETNSPTRKVTAAAIGGSVASVIISVAVWLGASQPPAGLEAAIGTLAAVVVAYFTSDSP